VAQLRQRRGGEAFDPIDLDTEALQLFNLCRDLSAAPRVERAAAKLRKVQDLFSDKDYHGAIEVLRHALRAVPITPRQSFEVDRKRFVELRDLRNVTQHRLASALALTPAAISHFEARGGKMRLSHLLLAAEWLDVPPSQFLRAAEDGSTDGQVGRSSGTRGGTKRS
jgi:hypothetical protein